MYIIALPEGLWGPEMVQSSSNFVEEFDGRTFRYELLPTTPLRRTFKMSKNANKVKTMKIINLK